MAEAQVTPDSVCDDPGSLVIGVLGGTGDEGRGLGRRLAMAGSRVIIGSRDPARAVTAAASIGSPPQVTGTANADAAASADVVIAAMPWEGHRDLLVSLAGVLEGKILVDCVNPLGFDARGAYPLPVAELLDPEVGAVDMDVLVLGDDRAATDLVQALAGRIPGMRGVYAGRLRNCGQVEALTANLVSVNRRYKAHAGLRITDI